MHKLKVILGSHNHVPFGSPEDCFESVYRARLKPFLAALYRHPKIPAALHYSGVLLCWLEKAHPEFFMLLAELVERKQVELIGGGFYEPMLPLIPLADKIGQVELLTTYLRKQFGKRPRGCWLPGMIWEQNLAGALQTSGMDYVFLEEDQFRAAGMRGPSAERPCFTEDQGKLIAVFPVSGRLGAQAAHKSPKELFHALRTYPGSFEERVMAIFPDRYTPEGIGDGGEEEGINRFFEGLSDLDDFVDLTVPSRALKYYRITEKTYFPSSADRRIMYWAMDGDGRKDVAELERMERRGELSGTASFMAGAFPRQFLVLYPEANGIYSKMMYTHLLINQLRGDKYRKRTAREELWKSQGCDAFWHVADGGIYRNGLRKAVYRSLLEAERITRERGIFTPSIVALDFDLDGDREFLFQGSEINAYIKSEGAAVFELDFLPKAWNYLDTMARRREPYVADSVAVDGYRRSAFMDRLVPPDLTLQDAASGLFPASRFCALERYDMVSCDRSHQEACFRLAPGASVPYGSVELLKTYRLKKNVLSVSYVLTNQGTSPERFNFIPQIDLSLAGDGIARQRISVLSNQVRGEVALETQELRSLDELCIEDLENEVPLSLTSNLPFDLWLQPIRTRCRIDGATVDEYQSTCLMPIKSLILAPGESWETQFTLKIGR